LPSQKIETNAMFSMKNDIKLGKCLGRIYINMVLKQYFGHNICFKCIKYGGKYEPYNTWTWI